MPEKPEVDMISLVEERSSFDPNDVEKKESEDFTFTPEERKKYVRKVDFMILPVMFITYMLLAYDKGILSHAVLFGFEQDLGLVKIIKTAHGIETNQKKYSDVVTIFYVGFTVGTYPMSWVGSKVGIKKFVAVAVFLWSVIMFTTPACKGYSGIMASRFFLGFLEGGIGPTFNNYMAKWWSRKEQSTRSSLWYSAYGFISIINAFIDYGLGTVHTKLAHWKPMFLFVGALTFVWSISVYFLLPDGPESWSRLSEREKEVIRRQSEKENHHDQKFDFKQSLEAIWSVNTWSAGLLSCFGSLIGVGLLNFLVLVIQGFGFDTVAVLALTVPAGVIYVCGMMVAGLICRTTKNNIFFVTIACDLLCITGALMCWLVPRQKKWVLYVGTLFLATQSVQIYIGYYLASVNTAGKSKKQLTNAFSFAAGSIGNIAGSYIFSSTPGPYFRGAWIGTTVVSAVSIVICVFSRFYFQYENSKKEKLGNEIENVTPELLTDKNDPKFRYLI